MFVKIWVRWCLSYVILSVIEWLVNICADIGWMSPWGIPRTEWGNGWGSCFMRANHEDALISDGITIMGKASVMRCDFPVLTPVGFDEMWDMRAVEGGIDMADENKEIIGGAEESDNCSLKAPESELIVGTEESRGMEKVSMDLGAAGLLTKMVVKLSGS